MELMKHDCTQREKKTDYLKAILAYIFQNEVRNKGNGWTGNLQRITRALRVSQTGRREQRTNY